MFPVPVSALRPDLAAARGGDVHSNWTKVNEGPNQIQLGPESRLLVQFHGRCRGEALLLQSRGDADYSHAGYSKNPFERISRICVLVRCIS